MLESSAPEFHQCAMNLNNATESEKGIFLIEHILEEYPVESYEELTKDDLVKITSDIWSVCHNFNKYNTCYNVHLDERKKSLKKFEKLKKKEQEQTAEWIVSDSIRLLGGKNG